MHGRKGGTQLSSLEKGRGNVILPGLNFNLMLHTIIFVIFAYLIKVIPEMRRGY